MIWPVVQSFRGLISGTPIRVTCTRDLSTTSCFTDGSQIWSPNSGAPFHFVQEWCLGRDFVLRPLETFFFFSLPLLVFLRLVILPSLPLIRPYTEVRVGVGVGGEGPARQRLLIRRQQSGDALGTAVEMIRHTLDAEIAC